MQKALANPQQIEQKGRKSVIRSNYTGMYSQKMQGEDGESPPVIQFSGTENGGSPLLFEQKMYGQPHTPSVNVRPYELLTPGQEDNMFSTAKKKGKLPKKNLVSSVA